LIRALEAVTFLVFLCWASIALPAVEYKIKEGDKIHISVWGEDKLDQETLVLPDGSISFPLVGNIKVSGRTAPDVENQITGLLDEYIPDPDVSVIVTAIEGNRVFVLGKVKTPGAIVLTGPLTVMQALSLVGGLDTFASENDIYILRRLSAGQEQLEVHYSDIMSGNDLSSNHPLEAGDTIFVP